MLAREDRPGDRRLVAYVVTAPGEDRGRVPVGPSARGGAGGAARVHDAGGVRRAGPPAALAQRQGGPRARCPRRISPRASRNAGGRVDPRDPLEERLAGIWQTVLGLECVGVHDNFFELGGDSLLGLRTVNRLRELLGGEPISLVVRLRSADGRVPGGLAAKGPPRRRGACVRRPGSRPGGNASRNLRSRPVAAGHRGRFPREARGGRGRSSLVGDRS